MKKNTKRYFFERKDHKMKWDKTILLEVIIICVNSLEDKTSRKKEVNQDKEQY